MGKAPRVFRKLFNSTESGLTTEIHTYRPPEGDGRLKSFSIVISGHWVPEDREDGLEALKTIELHLKKDLEWHRRVNKDIWNVLMCDLVYPDTVFASGSSFVQLNITGILKWAVTDYDAAVKDVMMVRELMLDVLEDAPFNYYEKKFRRI